MHAESGTVTICDNMKRNLHAAKQEQIVLISLGQPPKGLDSCTDLIQSSQLRVDNYNE